MRREGDGPPFLAASLCPQKEKKKKKKLAFFTCLLNRASQILEQQPYHPSMRKEKNFLVLVDFCKQMEHVHRRNGEP